MQTQDQTPEQEPGAAAHELAERLATVQSEQEFEDLLRAIAGGTGTRPETLRLALEALGSRQAKKHTWLTGFRAQMAQLDDATKRTIISAFLGLQASLVSVLGDIYGDRYGIGTIAQTALIVVAVYNLALTRKRGLGALAGASLGAAYLVGRAFFSWLLQAPQGVDGALIIPVTLAGSLLGYLAARLSDRILQLRFQHDLEKRREYLLRQLIELQEELRRGEQIVTFLSVDVIGSTRIKQGCDPLSAEYSFGEYTNYVSGVASQFGGSLHSTAGDGVMLAFRHPHEAFQAARRAQAGMLEFNTFRNKTGTPFSLRCGIHTGAVVAPSSDARSVAYSHVIDMTAHVQKAAPPGGIAVSEDAAVFLPGGPTGISPNAVEVQGLRAVIWQGARPTAPPAEAATAPPPPPFET